MPPTFLLLLAVVRTSYADDDVDSTTAEDEEDMKEVEAIVNQTDIIKGHCGSKRTA